MSMTPENHSMCAHKQIPHHIRKQHTHPFQQLYVCVSHKPFRRRATHSSPHCIPLMANSMNYFIIHMLYVCEYMYVYTILTYMHYLYVCERAEDQDKIGPIATVCCVTLVYTLQMSHPAQSDASRRMACKPQPTQTHTHAHIIHIIQHAS